MSRLREANEALRKSNYQKAIDIYQEILFANPDLYKIVGVNLNFAMRKMRVDGIYINDSKNHFLQVQILLSSGFCSKSIIARSWKYLLPNSVARKLLPTCLAPLKRRGRACWLSFHWINSVSKDLFMVKTST